MKNKYFNYEFILYGLILLIGIILRLVQLGKLPLSDAEAFVSLNALTQISGEIALNPSSQTFLVNIQSILFFLTDNGNFSARFFPAIIGTLFILVPFLYRKYVNPGTMLILAFWIAISPTFVSLSRQVDSTVLFLFSILLSIFFLTKRAIIASSIFLIISILSGEIFFWAILPVILSCFYVYLFINRETNSHYKTLIQFVKSIDWKRFGISSLISYVLLSTFGFIFPGQFTAIGYGINDFISSWGQLSGLNLDDIARGLLFYEIFTLIFGVIGIIYLIRNIQIVGLFLTGIITFSIVQIVLISEKNIFMLALIILPLMFAGSYFISKYMVLPIIVRTKVIYVTLISLSILVFIALAFMSMFNNAFQGQQENNLRIFFIIAGFGLIIGAGLLAGWAISWEVAGKSILYVSLIIFFILSLSASVNAAGLRHPYQNEILRIYPAPIEADLMVETLKDYSEWNYGDKNSIKIFVIGNQEHSVLWALRNFNNISFGSQLPMDEDIDAVVSNINFNLEQSESYRGQDFLWTSKPAWSTMNDSEFAQWYLSRRAPQDLSSQNSKILWIKNSLFPGTENLP